MPRETLNAAIPNTEIRVTEPRLAAPDNSELRRVQAPAETYENAHERINEMQSLAPLIIGVRDSGVGGLTVARCIRDVLPHAQLLYFADTAHVPYGGREADEVRYFALSIADFLISKGAQIVVFACNTSSAVALKTAQNTLPVPVFGTIEPGAHAAVEVTKNGRIGVLATHATVESAVYAASILALQPQYRVLEIACPKFVPLVESEETESAQAHAAALEYLRPLVEFGADSIVLGCTHYPLLLPVLQAAARDLGAPNLNFVDPAQMLAQQVQQLVAANFADASAQNDAKISQQTSDENTLFANANLTQMKTEYSISSPQDDANAEPSRTRLENFANETSHENVPRGDTFFVSGESDGVRHWVQNLLGIAQTNIEIGPIFEMSETENRELHTTNKP